MRSLLPFEGLFGNAVMNGFFDDVPASYTDYVTVPKVDIEEKEKSYEITCDMPGFTKEQIQISYDNGVLSLLAKKEEKVEEKDEEHHYIRRERNSSIFRRQFAVKGIEEKDIKAALKDGILTITLPKQSPVSDKSAHRIEIE